MNAFRLAPAAASALVVSACVTINVYFPAVAAERAADRIINDVWGPQQQQQQPPAQQPDKAAPPAGKPTSSTGLSRWATEIAMTTLTLVVPPAHAQADFDISSPAIRSLTASMESRHGQLKPLYDAGAIGLTADGLVEIRDPNAVPLQQRNQVKKLVADENADRNALYKEIATANKHPEWEKDIRATFAKRWIDKAQGGWWYQDAGGWKQK